MLILKGNFLSRNPSKCCHVIFNRQVFFLSRFCSFDKHIIEKYAFQMTMDIKQPNNAEIFTTNKHAQQQTNNSEIFYEGRHRENVP